MMVFASLSSLLLLSVILRPADAQSRTYRRTDPSTGATLECDRCPPGTYLREGCTSTSRSRCAPCPGGSFTELWNYVSKCLSCGVCGHNQVVKTACASDADRTCECKAGFYYRQSYDMCAAHSKCPVGEGVLAEGSPDNDTVCQVCPPGSFSSSVSTQQKCTVHRSCDSLGLKLLLRGSTWHDSLCASCGQLESRDGADHLRELLPPFFLHHNINSRRLRRIVQKLPGARPTSGSGQNLSVLERISAWAASATASQIRQLPDVLNRAGADYAGERLLGKLQRISASLRELCSAENEVDKQRR